MVGGVFRDKVVQGRVDRRSLVGAVAVVVDGFWKAADVQRLLLVG